VTQGASKFCQIPPISSVAIHISPRWGYSVFRLGEIQKKGNHKGFEAIRGLSFFDKKLKPRMFFEEKL